MWAQVRVEARLLARERERVDPVHIILRSHSKRAKRSCQGPFSLAFSFSELSFLRFCTHSASLKKLSLDLAVWCACVHSATSHFYPSLGQAGRTEQNTTGATPDFLAPSLQADLTLPPFRSNDRHRQTV
ncbi:hypothetical protein BCV70DRAFT_126611 [Testicularia cyperi]|uniref:Uncharacterized protein n=1 Tax=Testicularia cyperi TaxID=1882483 RepID=A0A317XLP3_9BASI|nr:hypothetical protein BCV70DRAFT_126611 [Testicularia cyperi]